MATASAVERAYDGYYNTIDDGGMDTYGYQMPAAAAAYNSYNNYYNGHDDAELVYAPYHVSRARRSPQRDSSLSSLFNELVRIELEWKRGLKSIFFPRRG